MNDYFVWYVASGNAEGCYWAVAKRDPAKTPESDGRSLTEGEVFYAHEVEIAGVCRTYRNEQTKRGSLLVEGVSPALFGYDVATNIKRIVLSP